MGTDRRPWCTAMKVVRGVRGALHQPNGAGEHSIAFLASNFYSVLLEFGTDALSV